MCAFVSFSVTFMFAGTPWVWVRHDSSPKQSVVCLSLSGSPDKELNVNSTCGELPKGYFHRLLNNFKQLARVGMCPSALNTQHFQTVGSHAKFKLLFEELLCKYTLNLVTMLESYKFFFSLLFLFSTNNTAHNTRNVRPFLSANWFAAG